MGKMQITLQKMLPCKNDAKDTKMEEANMIEGKLTTYWEAMEEQSAKEEEGTKEQMQHLTMQSRVLVELVKTQQRKIDKLLEMINR